MSWYKTGTVSVTQGSNAVIGTGTSFIANSRVGDAFRGPDGEWYEVTNIASDTALSISPNYQGSSASGGLYSLAPMQGYVKDSADALRAATKIITSGVADMTAQVAAATEAAESAGRSEEAATAQAGIATSAAETSTQNKDAASQSAQQSQSAAQASGSAAQRSEAARDSIVQSEAAAAESARAAAASAKEAEIVTRGKAASGANSDITSLNGLTTALSIAQGGTGGKTAAQARGALEISTAAITLPIDPQPPGTNANSLTAPGRYAFNTDEPNIAPIGPQYIDVLSHDLGVYTKQIARAITDDRKATRVQVRGTWQPWFVEGGGGAWGSITGALSAQADLQAVLNSKSSIGVGQAWQNVTSARAFGTNYTNSTAGPIMVVVEITLTTSAASNGVALVDGVTVAGYSYNGGTNLPRVISFIVPRGGVYSLSGAPTKNNWAELR